MSAVAASAVSSVKLVICQMFMGLESISYDGQQMCDAETTNTATFTKCAKTTTRSKKKLGVRGKNHLEAPGTTNLCFAKIAEAAEPRRNARNRRASAWLREADRTAAG